MAKIFLKNGFNGLKTVWPKWVKGQEIMAVK